MSRRRGETADPPGHDSFLDIVANLIGILVILIIVIGAQAADAMIEGKNRTDDETVDARAARNASSSVESDINQISGRLKRQDIEIKYRRLERDEIHYRLGLLEHELGERRDALDATRRERMELLQDIGESEARLGDLEQAAHALSVSRPSTQVLDHLPTPMAKTVFGKEIHFRLSQGRIAYVPWDELRERFLQEAPRKDWKLKHSDTVVDSIGPMQDFLLTYTLKLVQMRVPTRSGYALHKGMQPDRITIVPVREGLGDTVEDALRANSSFRARLELIDPDRTTITVWVYPDSFGQFRRIKEELFKLGFLCAGRPLPEGTPIGFSPHGTRSVAQ